MKIVSKYKDFYDFLAQDYDADIIYVREPKAFYGKYRHFYESKNDILMRRKYSGFCDPKLYAKARIKKGHITFGSYVFGVYPYVYSQPCAEIHYEYVGNYTSTELVILTKGVVDEVNKGNINALIDFCWNNLSEHTKFCLGDAKLAIDSNDVAGWIDKYAWKLECKELFEALKSPVFVEYEYALFQDTCYWPNFDEIKAGDDVKKEKTSPNIVTDISFNKLGENILKFWYEELNDLNTYINIENFLWSIKQEPESVPDNNTKIVSHGFDLKTSFRKM